MRRRFLSAHAATLVSGFGMRFPVGRAIWCNHTVDIPRASQYKASKCTISLSLSRRSQTALRSVPLSHPADFSSPSHGPANARQLRGTAASSSRYERVSWLMRCTKSLLACGMLGSTVSHSALRVSLVVRVTTIPKGTTHLTHCEGVVLGG